MRKTKINVIPITMLITPTLSQVMPEKLPLDQLCRFTMSESSANVTTKSVIAEQMYPIMIPHTTSRDIRETRNEMRSTKLMARSDPTKADATMPNELILMPCPSKKIMTSATTSFAPDEIPSTYGPAMGF